MPATLAGKGRALSSFSPGSTDNTVTQYGVDQPNAGLLLRGFLQMPFCQGLHLLFVFL